MSDETDAVQSVLAAHIDRLDTDACGAFVADLWAAQGYETTREGDVVVARRDGRTVTIGVGESGETARNSTDIIVAAGGTAVGAKGGRVVGAAELAERLWYAVDRPEARDLCERHLGGSPETLTMPFSTRVRRRLPSAPVFLAVALVVLAGIGIVAGVPPMSGSGDTGDAVPASEPPVNATDQSPTLDVPPPGLSASGIQNIQTLSAAHQRAVANRSLTLWIDRDRPQFRNGSIQPTTIDIDVTTDGERYRAELTEQSADNDTLLGTLYHDGERSYVEVLTGETVSYQLLTPAELRRSWVPTPSGIAGRLVTEYLSTPETTVTDRIERDGRTLYRVVGTGDPETPSLGNVQNYTVTALVSADGLVYDLTAEYGVVTAGRRYELTREFTYGRLDETTVQRPDWYEEQFANGTATG